MNNEFRFQQNKQSSDSAARTFHSIGQNFNRITPIQGFVKGEDFLFLFLLFSESLLSNQSEASTSELVSSLSVNETK